MPEWCPLLSEVTFDEATREERVAHGFLKVICGLDGREFGGESTVIAEVDVEGGHRNYGAASFTPRRRRGCDVEVKITYKTPRAIYAIVEGRRAQSIIRSLLRATLVRFAEVMEGTSYLIVGRGSDRGRAGESGCVSASSFRPCL